MGPIQSSISRRALLAAGLAVALVACGEIQDRSVVRAYLNEIDRLQNATRVDDAAIGARFDALISSDSRDAEAWAALYADVQASNARLLASLRALTPPNVMAPHHADLIGGLADLVAGIDDVTALIRGGDLPAANRAFQRIASRSGAAQTGALLQIRRVARNVGVNP